MTLYSSNVEENNNDKSLGHRKFIRRFEMCWKQIDSHLPFFLSSFFLPKNWEKKIKNNLVLDGEQRLLCKMIMILCFTKKYDFKKGARVLQILF